jgi:hypothetical protein
MKCKSISKANFYKGLKSVNLQFFGVFLLVIFTAAGCGKDDEPALIDGIPSDVYISGSSDVGAAKWAATYWKNEERIELEDGEVESFANKVMFYDDHVYGVGKVFPNQAVYWMDGERINLDSWGNSATAHDILFKDGKMYIMGEAQINQAQTPVYWIDGQMTACETNGNARGFTVSGGDIFIVGHRFINGEVYAGYWENGVWNKIGEAGSRGNGISITAGKFIICGQSTIEESENLVATLWENGSVIHLSMEASFAFDIKVHSGVTYVVGFEVTSDGFHDKAIVWKNGIATYLSEPIENADSQAISVEINQKGEVYVLGRYYEPEGVRTILWKDNKLTPPFETNKPGWNGWGLSLN